MSGAGATNEGPVIGVEGGVEILVLAIPGARRPGIAGIHAGRIKVKVSAPPEGGKANDAITRTLATALGIKRGNITLVSGRTDREKRFSAMGVGVQETLGALR